MCDKIFTTSLVAYSISLVVFLLGHYVLQVSPVIMTGIAAMGVASLAMAVSGLILVLNIKMRT